MKIQYQPNSAHTKRVRINGQTSFQYEVEVKKSDSYFPITSDELIAAGLLVIPTFVTPKSNTITLFNLKTYPYDLHAGDHICTLRKITFKESDGNGDN